MSDIAALTGQRQAIRELIAWATLARTDLDPTAVLGGPSGCGKTWVAQQVAEMVPSDITCIFANGDKKNASCDYLPFNAIAASRPRQSPVAAMAPEITRGLPTKFGALASLALKYILNRAEDEQVRRTFFLNPTDREIVLRLQYLAGHGRLLLVLDDLQWWDEKSIRLVGLMLSGRFNDVFPFLNRTSYLALTTTGQPPIAASFADLRAMLSSSEIELGYCDDSDFGAILVGLGLRTALRPGIARELYEITRGHLAIAQHLVHYLNRSRTAEELLSHKVFEDLCARVLDDRIKAAESIAPTLRDMLSCAAAIGMSFSRSELDCLTSIDAAKIRKCIQAAKELKLFEEHNSTLRFLHELFPRVLATRDVDENRELHARFADCLRRLRPGDYRTRARHYLEAGRLIDAHVMAIHALLHDVRQGRVAASGETFPAEGRHNDLNAFSYLMQDVYTAYGNGRYETAVRLCEAVDETLPRSLLAERDCVIALCKTKSLSSVQRKSAETLLQRWTVLFDDEPELWSRVTMARIVTLGQIDDGTTKAVVEEFVQRLGQRAEYDIDAERMLYRLKLRADLLYTPDVAHYRLREARDYFGPARGGLAARDPLRYYLALTNLIGNEVVLGRYEDACGTATICNEYVETVQGTVEDVRFPRPDVLANNTALSAYRFGRMSAYDAAEYMETVIAAAPPSNDLPLLQSNRAAYSILSNERRDETAVLAHWFAKLSSGDYEGYYRYFVGNNLAAAYLARTDLGLARNQWQTISPIVDHLHVGIRPYLSARHNRIQRILSSSDCTLESCEHALRTSAADAVGPGWDHFHHVFLLSDLQVWSDG